MVGLGDTRLGDDPSELTRTARGIQARVAREREETTSTGAVDGNGGRDKGKHSDRHSTAAAPTAEVKSHRGTAPGSERTTSSSVVSGVRAVSYALDGTVTAPSCPVVTAGDVRNAGSVVRSNSDEVIKTHTGMGACDRTQPSAKPAKVQWTSAGSYKDENDIWRGGVALGSYGEAVLRLFTVIDDCRGWGRYQGRIYQGRGGKRMVVVVVYAPDALYEEGSTEGNYSQRLGERAKASGKGVTADKRKPKLVPPKPTAEQVKHPKRLLWVDLEMHLRHYA